MSLEDNDRLGTIQIIVSGMVEVAERASVHGLKAKLTYPVGFDTDFVCEVRVWAGTAELSPRVWQEYLGEAGSMAQGVGCFVSTLKVPTGAGFSVRRKEDNAVTAQRKGGAKTGVMFCVLPEHLRGRTSRLRWEVVGNNTFLVLHNGKTWNVVMEQPAGWYWQEGTGSPNGPYEFAGDCKVAAEEVMRQEEEQVNAKETAEQAEEYRSILAELFAVDLGTREGKLRYWECMVWFEEVSPCSACEGTGKEGNALCHKCKGWRVLAKTPTAEVVNQVAERIAGGGMAEFVKNDLARNDVESESQSRLPFTVPPDHAFAQYVNGKH